MDVKRIGSFYIGKVIMRYDPENDAGRVTWADKELADALVDLTDHVIKLTDRVKELESSVNVKAVDNG